MYMYTCKQQIICLILKFKVSVQILCSHKPYFSCWITYSNLLTPSISSYSSHKLSGKFLNFLPAIWDVREVLTEKRTHHGVKYTELYKQEVS